MNSLWVRVKAFWRDVAPPGTDRLVAAFRWIREMDSVANRALRDLLSPPRD